MEVRIRCYVLCIEKYKAGGAFWTDLLRTYELDGNTFLSCDEGSIKAETGKGGTYLLFTYRLGMNRLRKTCQSELENTSGE